MQLSNSVIWEKLLNSFWYEPSLKEKSKKLRNNSTLTEVILWNKLKKKQILGFNFNRQMPINHFIVDFFCKELMLAIEVDGSSHNDKIEYDIFREEKLNKLGVWVLRFTNDEVLSDVNLVVEKITKIIKTSIPPT